MTDFETADALLASARGFILSGGAARRAGGMNKSMIEVEGRRIIEHQLERLRDVFPTRLTVITDRAADYDACEVETLGDFEEAPPEERFPLRGLARALDAAKGWAFILAADMPWPDPDLIREQARWLATRGAEDKAPPQGLALVHEGRLQPFHAFYHASLGVSAREALACEDRSLRGWIRSQSSIAVRPSPEFGTACVAGFRAFTGFNVPPPDA